MGVGALLAASGCTKLSPKTARVNFVGTESLREFESDIFLECVEPESQEMVERKLQRSSMDRPLYYSDKANRDQPATLDIPATYTLSAAAFQEVAEQGRSAPPRLVVQLRERTRVLKAKVYQIQTPMVDAQDKVVRKELTTEKFPRYYDWNWYPECKVRGERPIRYRIRELEGRGGVIHAGSGLLDEQGMIELELQPFLLEGAATGGLHIVFTCDKESLHAEVFVPGEVFAAHAATP